MLPFKFKVMTLCLMRHFLTIILILTELFHAPTLLQIFITMSSKMQNIDIEITLPGRFSKFSSNSILCFDKEAL